MTSPESISSRPRVLSGMRPTGRLHLGNYVGALRNWVALQNETNADGSPKYDCFFFIADYHALTTDYADPSRVAENTLEVAIDFLSAGLDPTRSTIFVQSHVSQHADLHLLFSMITPLGWLERVPSYKDQQENITGKDLTTYGFLGYPLLQSADILLYRPKYVPVGADQVAHVELTREVARRFNHLYRRTGARATDLQTELSEAVPETEAIFPEPDALLTATPKLPGLDGRKMSKSYGNTLALSEPEADLRAKIKVMVTDPARVRRTDPGNPDVCPVGDLHKIFSTPEKNAEVREGCTTAGIGCIQCKGWLADSVDRELAPIRERRAALEADRDALHSLLAQGAAKARAVAAPIFAEAKAACGLLPEAK